MGIRQNRLLIFGAGVIGSVYALRFAQYGLDVTVLARGKDSRVLVETLKRKFYTPSSDPKNIKEPFLVKYMDW